MPESTSHFSPALFAFLRDLDANNERAWFEENKTRYLTDVREPMQRFIADFGRPLRRISRHFVADPRPNGGSMFRIYRDVRFSKDKRPYKTVCSAQFRHASGRDVHAPGFYLHLGLEEVFGGAGLWRPDGESVKRIRNAIVDAPGQWRRICNAKAFREQCELTGERLKRPPRGFDPEHALIEDLKRKDFVAVVKFSRKEACSAGFLDRYAAACRTAAPLVRFLTKAVELPF